MKRAGSSLRHLARRLAGDRAGIAAIEFAYIFPLILLLLAGSYELSRAMAAQSQVASLSAQITSALSDCRRGAATCDAEMHGLATGILVAPQRLQNGSLRIGVYAVSRDGAGIRLLSQAGAIAFGDEARTAALAALAIGETAYVSHVTYAYASDLFAGVLAPVMSQQINFRQVTVGPRPAI